MTLRIAQESHYEGGDWWKWAVWLEGPGDELDEIRTVEWVLHPTFPEPVRTVTNRKSGFKLRSTGWGEFTIRARALRKDGKTLRLKHDLKLEYPTKEPPTKSGRASAGAEKKPPRVFISYSSAEREVAKAVAKVLSERGIEWTDPSVSVESGADVRATLAKTLATSDAVLALRSGASSTWADWEVSTARAHGVPILDLDVSAFADSGKVQGAEDAVREKIAKLIDSHLPK